MLKKTLVWTIIFFVSFGVCAKSGKEHVKDIVDCVFESNRSPQAERLARYISEGMDMGSGSCPTSLAEEGSSFLNTVRADLGSLKGFGSHRELGHWALDGAIPHEYLDRLSPADRELFVMRWQEFVATRTEAVRQAFNLHGEGGAGPARAFAAMIDDVHNLGDYTTKNTTGLRDLRVIAENYFKSVERILGKNNGLTTVMRDEIKALPIGITDAERAKSILKILKSHNGELFERIERVFARYGYDGRLRDFSTAKIAEVCKPMPVGIRNTWMKNRMARNEKALAESVGDKLKKATAAKSSKSLPGTKTKIRKVYPKAKVAGVGKVTTRGFLQKIYCKDGAERYLLSVHLSDAAYAGLSAGVFTFLIDEGITCIGYAQGEMTDAQFQRETGKNCAKGIMTGTATYVAVALGAAPGGWIVMGIGIGAYMLSDVVCDSVCLAIDGPEFSLDDILGELPTELQRREGLFEYEALESAFDFKGRESVFDFKGNESVFDYEGHESALDYSCDK